MSRSIYLCIINTGNISRRIYIYIYTQLDIRIWVGGYIYTALGIGYNTSLDIGILVNLDTDPVILYFITL